jgi:quinoprotein glucose dehydrogenase
MGGVTAYDLRTGDKKWWFPNGNAWREQSTNSPLFAGVTLPRVPVFGGQSQVINTKTLLIYGTGRSGASGGRAGGGGRGGRGGGGAAIGAVTPGGGGAPVTPGSATDPMPFPPSLYAVDKATGQEVAKVRIPQVNTAVPMTFMHKGRQYIVFAYGQGANTGLTALTLPVAPNTPGTR